MYFNFTHESQKLFDEGVACACLSGIAVIVRLYCKIKYKQGIHFDDVWIIIGLVSYWTMTALFIWGKITGGGGGVEVPFIMKAIAKDRRNAQLYKNFVMSHILAVLTLWISVYALKMSVLLYYRRIFRISKGYQRTSLAVILVTTAWFISSMVAWLCMRKPFDAFWNLLKPRSRQLHIPKYYLAMSIVDIVLDAVVLLLPIRMAFTLQLPLRTKLGVAGIFGLGSVSIITNIVRIDQSYVPHAKYILFEKDERWANFHLLTAFVCACLPIYKRLWNNLSQATGAIIARSTNSLQSIFSSRSGSDSSGNGSTNKDLQGTKDSYARMDQSNSTGGSQDAYKFTTEKEFGPNKLSNLSSV